jgi:hypothetical protein
MCKVAAFVFAVLASVGTQAQPARLPLFDAHLHYNDDARGAHPLDDVLERFRAAGVATILATSRPNEGTHALVVAAARAGGPRVVPFIRPYRNHADRATWFADPSILALIEGELARPVDWRGIGEFHVFGNDAATPLVRRIVELAVRRGLWLHAHCDERALDHLLAHDPGVRIVWAHTGFTTSPARIAEYLERHPNLVGELSYRHDIVRDGRLTAEWRALFLRFPGRFLLGSDTWVNARWSQYDTIMAGYRSWLDQLPADVAAAIAHRNGERLFGPGP